MTVYTKEWKSDLSLYSEKEKEYIKVIKSLATVISSNAKDNLIALVEAGPLFDGDVPSKSGRDELISLNLAEKIVVKGKDGYQAATYKGRDVYSCLFNGDTLFEAQQNRKGDNHG